MEEHEAPESSFERAELRGTNLFHMASRNNGLSGISLPLVSVIIVNYNYGRFLWQAVTSVFEQTYTNIECIIVDNASTDESVNVLARVEQVFPQATIIRCEENGGQSAASMRGYAESSGQYVIFVDADDFLLPECLATHIFVHLSARIPVGFTSGDMAQSVGPRLVLGTMSGLSDYVYSGRGRRDNLLRRIDHVCKDLWPFEAPDEAIAQDVHYVPPEKATGWVWSATSGNCFRREALQLFLDNRHLPDLRACTDAYLLRGIGMVIGSILIDRPIAVYRLHGQNVFSRSPQLNRIAVHDRGAPSDNDLLARRLVMDHLVDNFAFFAGRLYDPHALLWTLKRLDRIAPKLPPKVPGCKTYLGGKVLESVDSVKALFGRWKSVCFLLALHVSVPAIIGFLCRREHVLKEKRSG